MWEKLEQRLAEKKTSLRDEVLGGVTTFATMAYIAVVNPSILSTAVGEEWMGALMIATCLSAAVATALMGALTDYPIALAPGMGLNAYFTYTVCLQMEVPWQIGLGAVFISGVLFLALTAVNVQEMLVNAIPASIRHGTAAGIGIFIAFIGLQNSGIIVENPATLVSLGDYASAEVLLALAGIILIGSLTLWKVRGAIIIGILAVSVVGILFGVSPPPEAVAAWPMWPGEIVGQAFANLGAAFDMGVVTIVVTFLFVDLFDTAGTLTGVGSVAGLVDEKGRLPKARRAFIADGLGTCFGAAMGTSTVTSYIESAAGVAQGARTGLANYVTAALFLLAIPLFPLAKAIPGYATAPALFVVGVIMCSQIAKIDWDDIAEALPGMAVMIGIPLTYSIADGLSLAFLIHPVLLGTGGRWRDVHWLGWLLAALVVLRYSLL